jgi:hypothetical protein
MLEGTTMRQWLFDLAKLLPITKRRSSTCRALIPLGLILSVSASAAIAGTSEQRGRKSGVGAGEGVGMYRDPSTANQASTFTISGSLVSCGVGAENLEGIGRFEMLMYSTRIGQYIVSSARKEITARGQMRSITRAGGAVVEDVRHRFIAHARDLDGDEAEPRGDRFDVHFRTDFWQPGNPLCTPSERYPGLCRFGGRLFAGDVHVSTGEDEHDRHGN